MRVAKTLAALTVALLLAGCVPSLHSLFTDQDLIFDPALLGTWVEKDGDETWELKKTGEQSYTLVHTEKGEARAFEAHLVQFGPHRFLDVYPEEPEMRNEFYKFHLIPVHSFIRVRVEGEVLRVQMLDDERLKELIFQKKISIGHERLGDLLLLTAPTKELRQFLLKYAEDPKAFADPTELHRQK